jgi:hypothetical protein
MRNEQLAPTNYTRWRNALTSYGKAPAVRAVLASDSDMWLDATVSMLLGDSGHWDDSDSDQG